MLQVKSWAAAAVSEVRRLPRGGLPICFRTQGRIGGLVDALRHGAHLLARSALTDAANAIERL
jgi:hypothetical protein